MLASLCVPTPGVAITANQEMMADFLASTQAAAALPDHWPLTHRAAFAVSPRGECVNPDAAYTLAFVDLLAACMYRRPAVALSQRLGERFGQQLSIGACLDVVACPKLFESVKAPFWRILAVRVVVLWSSTLF
jgi:hypothetical protein